MNAEEILKQANLKSSAGITVAVAVLLAVFVVRRALSKRDNIPTVPYIFPFIGSTLTYAKDPAQFAKDAAERYGNVFRVNLFGQMVTVVGGEDAREIYRHPDMSLAESQQK
ncbi:hypothetical protein DFQ28_007477, partial [Apophysomyces sp. BC1034]